MCDRFFQAALSQMYVRQISNSVSHVCDTVVKQTHSIEPLASFTDWQVVQCVTDMSQNVTQIYVKSDISVTQNFRIFAVKIRIFL